MLHSRSRTLVCALAALRSQGRLLTTGSAYNATQVFTQQDVDGFVGLSGDSNPIHVDPSSAAAAGYEAPIVPGMLMASMFPAIIGSTFPGALYLTQTLKFRRHACVGTTVHAEVIVATRSGQRVTFNTTCKDALGNVLVDGTALALIKEPT